MTICLIVVYAILAWALLNVLVASAAAMWYRAWCRSVPWTSDGIMPSAVPIDEGSGEDAVLFVHGFNDVPYVWRRFVDELAARGFHCQAMRLPGAGEADCRPSLGVLRKAVDDELRTLKAAHRRVVLVGHSMGGALSLDAVLRASGAAGGVLPDKLVLLAPLIEVSQARCPVLTPYVWYRILRALLPLLRWVPSVFKEYLHAEDDHEFVYRRDRFNEIGWYTALFSLVASIRRADRRKVVVPTVVYVGGNDRVVDSNAARLWFADVPCARIVDCPGASHVIPLNYVWNGVISEISDKQKERNIYLK